MIVDYLNEKVTKELSDKKKVDKSYAPRIHAKIERFIENAIISDTIEQFTSMHRGLNIHKKKNATDTYIGYLDKQWRIEFKYQANEDDNYIYIIRVHPHSY